MDLHSYDRITNFKVEDDILLLDKQIKKNKVIQYVHEIQPKISPQSNVFLMGIMNQLDAYDQINQIYVLDLMYICSDFTSDDFISEFDTQLFDMSTGFCEQGRTIRLIQLIRAFS